MSEASKKPEPEVPAEVRHLPVHLPGRAAPPAERAPAAIATPLAAATGGLLAGIATMVLVRLLRRGPQRRLVIGRRRRGRAPEIAATRSFLVDVHVLKR